jgi:hypothetical protein
MFESDCNRRTFNVKVHASASGDKLLPCHRPFVLSFLWSDKPETLSLATDSRNA